MISFLIWLPAPVYAASITYDEIASFDVRVLAFIFIISTLSNITALLWRIDRELRVSTTGTLPRPWLFASFNLCGGWLSGGLGAIMGLSTTTSLLALSGTVIIASFAGARALEAAAEKWIKFLGADTKKD